ncbi:type I inositol polyphosphate 5-phosphatase 5 [Senna tora]|uniref:Type I inositol polyphosphate 5-phosphatase 5 n=1 Tax=Senna tora TaxID=362788 RepID=A0A834X9I2_9FABA|nr:type I inositol polyphosphate 5-phosphatase 5 [Senna tora]
MCSCSEMGEPIAAKESTLFLILSKNSPIARPDFLMLLICVLSCLSFAFVFITNKSQETNSGFTSSLASSSVFKNWRGMCLPPSKNFPRLCPLTVALTCIFQSLLPKIFGSKKNGRGSDDEDLRAEVDRIVPGITFNFSFNFMLFFLISLSYCFFLLFPNQKDLEKIIDSRRKSFTPIMRKSFSGETSPAIEGLNLSNFEHTMAFTTEIQSCRIFVATWNVGGKTPNQGLKLEDFLLVEGSADIYVLGFQEIVPLSAGNVLVIEDNEPAVKWLALINQALNRPKTPFSDCSTESNNSSGSKDSKNQGNLFQKPNLKLMSRNYRVDSSLLKGCNCPLEAHSPTTDQGRRIRTKRNELMSKVDSQVGHNNNHHLRDPAMDEFLSIAEIPLPSKETKYCLISSKQMVGIFLSVWTRKDLVPHIAHLRVDSVGRGIMGRLGNKLNTERDAGRVFTGFDEGRIVFAPTYKYSQNSDSYAGETVKSKKKRRTPAWCDRILWRGKGIEQLSYIRGESRFSDHRPVCGVFAVDVEARCRKTNNRFRKGYSYACTRFEYDDCIPQRHSFYD